MSAECSLAAHTVLYVVPNLSQEHHVHHTDPYTNNIGHTRSHIWSHYAFTSRVLHDASLSIIEVMHIDRAYYGVSYPSYQLSMLLIIIVHSHGSALLFPYCCNNIVCLPAFACLKLFCCS